MQDVYGEQRAEEKGTKENPGNPSERDRPLAEPRSSEHCPRVRVVRSRTGSARDYGALSRRR